ncbi:MAG: PorV/PorQ family protein [Bacteroidia bacterium]|nr:PorV/PorQ family protein [Bacteroidia bacterium]
MNFVRFCKHILGVIGFVAGLNLSVYAQEPKAEARKYSNEFLKIGVGARAFGMGHAMIATSDDVLSGYWNPAGLVHGSMKPEVSLMYSSYFANIATYNYAGFSLPLDSAGNRRFGVSVIRLGVDNIPNTLDLVSNGNIDFNKVKAFSTSDFATLISYAWRPASIPRLSFGTNFKVIYRGVGRFGNAWGFGLDVAAKYKTERFAAGLMLMDATQTYNMWTFNTETFGSTFISTGNVIPENSVEITRPTIRLGVAYNIINSNSLGLLLALDNDVFLDGKRSSALISAGAASFDPRVGLEFAYKNKNTGKPIAFLRGGVYNLQNTVNGDGEEVTGIFPTAGLGFVIKGLQVDYALANIGNFQQNLYSHVVSLKLLVPSKTN